MCKSPISLLVTGFGPFPGVAVNPSAQIVANLKKNYTPPTKSIKLNTAIIPTEWTASRRDLARLHQTHHPDLSIHFGVHSKSNDIRIEAQAKNEIGGEEDACGDTLECGKIDEALGSDLTTGLDVNWIARQAQLASINAKVSDNAGCYLCNYIYFHALSWSAQMPKPNQALFIHIPNPEHAESPDLDDLTLTAEKLVKITLTHFRQTQEAQGLQNTGLTSNGGAKKHTVKSLMTRRLQY